MELLQFRENHENGTQQIFPGWDLLTSYNNRKAQLQWFQNNWNVCLYAISIYLLFIYFGQKYFKNRKPLDLQTPLILWNFLLAAFSICGSYVTVQGFVGELSSKDGLYKSICSPWELRSDATYHWTYLFLLSKVIELLDTVFIVLRKKPLLFLHWYHHITVLFYCWFSAGSTAVSTDLLSTALWFTVMNYVVHSVMYTYYGLRAMKIQIHSKIAMTITTLQLLQMAFGLYVIIYATTMKFVGTACAVSSNSLYLALGMYSSYFVLFGMYFYNSYFSKKSKRNTIKRS